MEMVSLGNTGIAVSRFCFGSLTMGPLKADCSVEQGSDVMAYAIQRGIRFFDTAQLYRTYPFLRRAMEKTGCYDLIICTKTFAYTREMAIEAVEEARSPGNRRFPQPAGETV